MHGGIIHSEFRVVKGADMPNDRETPLDLIAENKRLKEENRELLRVLHALTHEDFPINREEILAQIGKSPSFEEFLNSLEARSVMYAIG